MLLRRQAEEILELVDKTEKELGVQDENVEGVVSVGCGEYYGGIDFTPANSGNGQLNFENGGITYCRTNNTMAIFYAQTLPDFVILRNFNMVSLKVFFQLPSVFPPSLQMDKLYKSRDLCIFYSARFLYAAFNPYNSFIDIQKIPAFSFYHWHDRLIFVQKM